MARRKADLAGLQARLGYAFSDTALLERALTHVSAVAGEPTRSNQRLEFLGDRVLGLAVADLLYDAFPTAPEGELSHRLSDLVRREACAVMAASWDLAPELRLGSGEGKAGGRRNAAILADAAEAVLGAVHLDGGFAAAQGVIAAALRDRIASAHAIPRDPKTALQEWAQGLGHPPPAYAIVERSGPDHAPRFRIAARVSGLEEAIGDGSSKRAAEQDAAQAVLVREGVWPGIAP